MSCADADATTRPLPVTTAAGPYPFRRPWFVTLAPFVALALVVSASHLSAQALTVNTAGETLHIKAPALHFIERDTLISLKDGRSVRIDFELAVLQQPGPSATAVVQAGQSFVLSYDLWEERFAVTQVDVSAAAGSSPRSASHLTSKDAETWCLDRVTVSV